jgi:hypothetical protein
VLKPQIPGQERRAGPKSNGASAGVRYRRTIIRPNGLECASPHVRQGSLRAIGERPVEKAREREVLGETARRLIPQGGSLEQRGGAQRDEGHHINHAETGMNALVEAKVEMCHGPPRQLEDLIEQLLGGTQQGHHTSMVVSVEVKINSTAQLVHY